MKKSRAAGDRQMLGLEFRLREKWDADPITKNSKTISEGMGKIESGYRSNDPASYLTMVYGLMKMQDPGSTVRESEFQTGEGIGGWPEKWKAAYQKATGDMRGPITQIQKDAIMSQARGIFDAQMAQQQAVNETYKDHAAAYGFDPRRIVMDDVVGKKKIKVSNGKESFEVDKEDLPAAMKDGFKVVK